MIEFVSIKNFKSITTLPLELGNVNVFIGANGSGKSNILEAIGMVAAERSSFIEVNNMIQKGVRIAKPDLTISSFYGQPANNTIEIELITNREQAKYKVKNSVPKDIYSPWLATYSVREKQDVPIDKAECDLRTYISKYLIYSLSVHALRGLTSESLQYPLGINGEGLDVLLNNLPKEEIFQIKEAAQEYILWMDDIFLIVKNSIRCRVINWDGANRTFISGISSCKRGTTSFQPRMSTKVHWSCYFILRCLLVKKRLIFSLSTILKMDLILVYVGP